MEATAQGQGGDLVLIQEATAAELWCRVITGSRQCSGSLPQGVPHGVSGRVSGRAGSQRRPHSPPVRSSRGCGFQGLEDT